MESQNGQQQNLDDVERFSVFELAGTLFGIEILRSREVIPLPRFTPIPNSDDIFYGVFNLRGEIIPLIDISVILGLHPKAIQSDDMVIVVDAPEHYPLGLLVDKIHSIAQCLPAEIEDAEGKSSNEMQALLRGILEYQSNKIHILDIDNLFGTEQILAHF